MIEKIVQEAACPVIVLIHEPDPDFVREASKRGIFAYITDADPADWQSSIDIVLRRFTEYHELEGAFGRRAVTERAKAKAPPGTTVGRAAPVADPDVCRRSAARPKCSSSATATKYRSCRSSTGRVHCRAY